MVCGGTRLLEAEPLGFEGLARAMPDCLHMPHLDLLRNLRAHNYLHTYFQEAGHEAAATQSISRASPFLPTRCRERFNIRLELAMTIGTIS